MTKFAKSGYEGRLKELPENRKILQQRYPGWAVLVETLTTPSLRAKDVRGILGLTYRQIYHWHTRKLLWSKQGSGGEWRRFSIGDILGLALVKQVAELGIPFDKLQKSFAIRYGVPTYLWRALPYLVAGREAYLYTDFESFLNFVPDSGSMENRLEVGVDSQNARPILVLRINPIIRELVGKLHLSHFKVSADTDGSYSFEIKGVPLKLEDLRETEEDSRRYVREREALRTTRRKGK